MTFDARVIARLAVAAAEAKKAMDVKVLNIGHVSVIADYFVICSARSSVHAKAVAEAVDEKLQQQGIIKHHVEGLRTGRWILLDYGSVVVHVFHEEERAFYNLEHLWGDAPEVEIPMNL